MRRNILFAFLLLCLGQSLFAQSKLNIDSISHLSYPTGVSLNDIWGYVDSSGIEYALVGKTNGLSVVSTADTNNLVELFSESSVFSIWRDIKTWGNYAYVTNESAGGLAIYDLSTLPDSVKSVSYHTGTNFSINSAHNIYIDENGVAYLFGSNHLSGSFGTIMLDVATNPGQPIELGFFDSLYLHDGYARGDTLYGSAVYDGLLVVIDVSDKSNPVIIGSKTTPSNFTHNSWPSDNSSHIFTTDEVVGGYVAAYDVRNLNNIVQADRMRSRNTTNVIPHNTHVLNDFLITSYYTLGVSIVDANKPDNLIEVGYFDTSPNFTGGTFNGNWGAYPYFPSGRLILSDIENGLFLMRPDYVRASYLEGTVKDCNGLAISQADVKILASNTEEKTNLLGNFKTGTHLNGYLQVEVSKVGYMTRVYDSVLFVAGQVTNTNFELLANGDGFSVLALDANSNPIQNVEVELNSSLISGSINTNSNGIAFFQNMPFSSFQVKAGKWGYLSACQLRYDFNCANKVDTVVLDLNYKDNFSSDLGWVSSGGGSGAWTRARPLATIDMGVFANPSGDYDGVCDGFAYVTGNSGLAANQDDLDGSTSLTSHSTNLSAFVDPYLQFHYWMYNRGVASNDDLILSFQNNTGGLVVVDTIQNAGQNQSWIQKAYRVNAYMNPNDFDKIVFLATDNAPDDVFEVAIDNLFISEGASLTLPEQTRVAELSLIPNPTSGEFRLELNSSEFLSGNLELFDVQMRLIQSQQIESLKMNLRLGENQPAGLYFVRLTSTQGLKATLKLVKN